MSRLFLCLLFEVLKERTMDLWAYLKFSIIVDFFCIQGSLFPGSGTRIPDTLIRILGILSARTKNDSWSGYPPIHSALDHVQRSDCTVPGIRHSSAIFSRMIFSIFRPGSQVIH